MSVEEMYPERGRSGPRLDDPYATRQFPLHEITEHRAEGPIPAGAAVPQPVRRRPSRGVGMVILNAALIVLIIALLVAGVGLYYLDRSYQGKIYPNVSVQGLQLGELTPAQAEAALRARYGVFLQRPATLTYGDRTWQPGLSDVGVSFDFKGAIDAAYRAGRGNGLLENLREVYTIWQNGLDLPVRVSFDQNAMRRYVETISANLNQAPLDAQLQLVGTTVATQPARLGRQVLVDQIVQELTQSLRTFTPQTIALRTRTLPPRLDDAPVKEARQQIEAILQGPLTLTVGDKEYIWEPEDIALMLQIARVPATHTTDRVDVAVNRYHVDRRVIQIADETGRGSVNPRVSWNDGDLKIIRPGKPGLRVDEKKAAEVVLASMGSQNRVVALPVREVEPQVTEANLHTLGIEELVSLGQSDFTGSAEYRINNIGVGMNILNGILIAPGEEFSFNENIGSIDAKNGFVEGYAIIQNRTQLEFGGGICQDSTTLFRAAFWAGLPITERWGHSFYISWYDKYGLGKNGNGPGLDATIFTGGPDLKFVNDTGRWLLLQSSSNPRTGLAQVALYGTKPNRQVDLIHRIRERVPAPTEPQFVGDPKQPRGTHRQSDRARGGMTIDVYRIITENGVRREPELFRTKFKPWPNIYVFNPRDLGPDGKPIQWFSPDAAPQPTPAPAPEQPAPAPEQPAPAPEQPTPVPEQPTPVPAGG